MFSMVAFAGAVLLLIGFWSRFRALSMLQKVAIILVCVGALTPMILGTIVGTLSHLG